jgi:hypothetical protein
MKKKTRVDSTEPKQMWLRDTVQFLAKLADDADRRQEPELALSLRGSAKHIAKCEKCKQLGTLKEMMCHGYEVVICNARAWVDTGHSRQ